MQLLIQWPYSLYDEGYCAVIVSCDGDMTTLLEQAVYAVARHRSSQFCTLTGARPPHPIVQEVNGPGATGRLCTLGDFALYKDGVELPRTGTLAEAGITDRDSLMLDYVARDRFGKGKPAKESAVERIERATFDGPCEPLAISEETMNRLLAGNRGHQEIVPIIDEPMANAIRVLIREEIAAHERKQWERVKYRRHSGEASSGGPREYPFPFD